MNLRFDLYQWPVLKSEPFHVASFINLEMADSFAKIRYGTGYLIKKDGKTVSQSTPFSKVIA